MSRYDAAVDELLEQAEKEAKAKDATTKNGGNTGSDANDGDVAMNGDDRDSRRETHSRKNRYSVEREENNERRSRRSKEMADDEEMKDSSDRGSANGSVRDRERRRSRTPGSDRRPVGRDFRESRGDFYAPGPRGSDDDRYRPSPRDRDTRRRSRSPRPDRRADRDAGRYRDDRRDDRRRRHSPRRPKTPEPTDDERDRRTVFVQQLAARLRTKELQAFFEQVGPVVEAQIVKDRVSGRSKG